MIRPEFSATRSNIHLVPLLPFHFVMSGDPPPPLHLTLRFPDSATTPGHLGFPQHRQSFLSLPPVPSSRWNCVVVSVLQKRKHSVFEYPNRIGCLLSFFPFKS
ncbi:hypothetical protein CDAR_496211 [Caerostris darwini]|uniref:Uncharacterized protein n=1 Tax=Caerostris darwini TaxID=1538125 RepID=A0AAV4U1S6_9ARAC|nr:hypothetical protein CDAR_496211 [Caerostris darwini]